MRTEQQELERLRKENEQSALEAQKLIEMKNAQLAKAEKKVSQLVVDQVAKDAELKYYEELHKSLAQYTD
jgi:soluble cytochrome b562